MKYTFWVLANVEPPHIITGKVMKFAFCQFFLCKWGRFGAKMSKINKFQSKTSQCNSFNSKGLNWISLLIYILCNLLNNPMGGFFNFLIRKLENLDFGKNQIKKGFLLISNPLNEISKNPPIGLLQMMRQMFLPNLVKFGPVVFEFLRFFPKIMILRNRPFCKKYENYP